MVQITAGGVNNRRWYKQHSMEWTTAGGARHEKHSEVKLGGPEVERRGIRKVSIGSRGEKPEKHQERQ